MRRVNWYLIDEELQAGLLEAVEPGDVLLARKNWYVSNVGLPGFWPHAILYIGDPQQFAAYFDDPQVRAWVREQSGEDLDFPTYLERRWSARWLRYQFNEHGQPYRVIEAISEGVSFSTLDHAAGDYLVALRPRLDKLAKAAFGSDATVVPHLRRYGKRPFLLFVVDAACPEACTHYEAFLPLERAFWTAYATVPKPNAAFGVAVRPARGWCRAEALMPLFASMQASEYLA